jgi:hypothetical protein
MDPIEIGYVGVLRILRTQDRDKYGPLVDMLVNLLVNLMLHSH